MKVFVDELPENCRVCLFKQREKCYDSYERYEYDVYYCGLLKLVIGDRRKK